MADITAFIDKSDEKVLLNELYMWPTLLLIYYYSEGLFSSPAAAFSWFTFSDSLPTLKF